MSFIELNHISKEYVVIEKTKNPIGNFFKSKKKVVNALNDLCVSINSGELVGLIGENGAGKSTTFKIMSGILYPSSGEVRVNGLIPYKEKKKNAYSIGTVFGQRSRLLWDLPMTDSFELYKEMYRVEEKLYKKNLDMFVEVLDLKSILKVPVRQLSLGQRMKAEIALALVHNPSILYLDEPTIGLDVLAKQKIRDFIKTRNAEFGTTCIISSHDMRDIDEICSRIVMLNKGIKIYDGDIKSFKEKYADYIIIDLLFEKEVQADILNDLPIKVLKNEANHVLIRCEGGKKTFTNMINQIDERCKLLCFEIKNIDIEDIVRDIYINNID